MQSTKSVDVIGDGNFLMWQQLNGCSMTRPFLSVKGVACETRVLITSATNVSFFFLKFPILKTTEKCMSLVSDFTVQMYHHHDVSDVHLILHVQTITTSLSGRA